MKEKLKNFFTPIGNWFVDNKDWLVVVLPIGLLVVGKTITAVRIHSNNVADIKMKENYIYDRSLGYSLRLKRRLTAKQLELIQARKDNGEKLINILSSMRVLK